MPPPVPRAAMSPRERSLRSQLTRLTSGQGLIDGSLVVRHHRCGKSSCRCSRDPRFEHRAVSLICKQGGRVRQLYVPKDWEPRVRQWLDNYHELRRLTRELCQLHWQAVLQREGKRGRAKGQAQSQGREGDEPQAGPKEVT